MGTEWRFAENRIRRIDEPFFVDVEVLVFGRHKTFGSGALLLAHEIAFPDIVRHVDLDGVPSMDIRFNPNASYDAIEGITSPDGRVLGKMGHSERIGFDVCKNVPGKKDQKIFESGVAYFK